MTKDNHMLGKFELTGIPPAPRGVPQIEVTFEVDANGILQVSAEDKGTGKAEKITITAEKGRLSDEEIQRMVREAEQYADEDKKVKERIDARNGLESYIYNLKNTLEDDEKGLADTISAQDKKELQDMIDETLDWMDENPEADKEDYNAKLKEVEQVANPIMRNLYSQGGAGAGAAGDFGDVISARRVPCFFVRGLQSPAARWLATVCAGSGKAVERSITYYYYRVPQRLFIFIKNTSTFHG